MNFTGPLSGLNGFLRLAGVNKAEREVRMSPELGKEPIQEPQTNGMPLSTLLWLGARLPFAAFIIILVLFTYVYHISPIVPWLAVFFSLNIAIFVTWPPKEIGGKSRTVWDWASMWSWLFAVGFAVGLGLVNYNIIEAWVNTAFLREYKDVLPSADPMTVIDGGILNFASGTRLDVEKSAGYKFWLYNYCAAPIVGKDPFAAPVTFWAVGVGCCSSRGEFTCNSAEDKDAKSAMPLRAVNLGPEITAHYNSAIRMSAAANDLDVSREHVFVAWHKEPHKVGDGAWWLATMLFIVLSLVAFCSCITCQSAITHMSYMQQ